MVIGARKQQDELLSSIAEHYISNPDMILQILGKLRQDTVSGRMAVHIIHLLEMIQIKDGNRKILIAPF
ncbi:Uncharacterised protein [Mycobacteroides abscessus subsp. abscessus]|nr:Uncharacterised protein [Mycobacteroides abscessus subsp. abscessus]